jgi:hypothetical protein
MYKPIYDKASGFKKIGEIATWVFLLFLIPSTALGYFAEQSIPGQPLFPVKLGIENVILDLQSFNPEAQASYQVGLVNKRFDEVQALLTKDTTNAGDLNNFGIQLKQATQYIVSLPPSPEKTALQEKLATNIDNYQQQLKIQQQIVENKEQIIQYQSLQNNINKSSNFTLSNQYKSIPTNIPTPTLIPNNTTEINQTQTFPTTTPIPTPTSSPTPTQNSQDLSSVDQTLQDIQNQLQDASNSLQQNNPPPPPPSTPTSTPMPTAKPAIKTNTSYYFVPTSTPIPTKIPTPTPDKSLLCSTHAGHCISSYNPASHCPGYFITQYDYPYSCTSQYPICCSNYVPPTPTPTPNPALFCSQHGGHCISNAHPAIDCAKTFITQYDYPASCTQQYPICCAN